MQANEIEKGLDHYLLKCRCCLRMIINSRGGSVEIDENIQNQFFLLTSCKLIESEYFSNRICQLCASDLQGFADLRNDLVSKQTTLYNLAGLDIQNYQNSIINQTISEVIAEGTSSYDMEYETGQDYEEGEMLEEVVEETELNEVLGSSILKIEKIPSAICQTRNKLQESDYYGEDDSKIIYEEILKSEDKEEEVICNVCSISVIQSHLEEHIEVMHTESSVTCEKCKQKFHSKLALRKHFNEEHSANSREDKRSKKRKLHYCPLCTKEYDYKKQLTDHIRSFHQKVRNTECNICHRRFYHRDLKKHIEHVHGEKKVSCEVCGKMYSCYDNLKLHMRYHSVPQYVCDTEGCGKRFHQKTLLEHHKLKHGDKKQVECNECNSSFFTTRDLKRHIQRVHEKVYRQCAVCEMTFCRKDKYREHVLKSHKNLPEHERTSIINELKNLNWYEK